MIQILRAAGFHAIGMLLTAVPDGATGAAAPTKSEGKAFKMPEWLGFLKPEPQFSINVGDPQPIDKGKLKGYTRQRLADVVVPIKGSGIPFAGCALMVERDTAGNPRFFFKWPSTGSGVFSKQVINVKGNGTKDVPQYAKEAAELEEVGKHFTALGVAYLKAEKAAGRGIGANKGVTVMQGSVTASAEDMADIGL